MALTFLLTRVRASTKVEVAIDDRDTAVAHPWRSDPRSAAAHQGPAGPPSPPSASPLNTQIELAWAALCARQDSTPEVRRYGRRPGPRA